MEKGKKLSFLRDGIFLFPLQKIFTFHEKSGILKREKVCRP